VRLSRLPSDTDALDAFLRQHPGILEIRFGACTRSVLYRFNPSVISHEELLIRTAFYLSREAGGSAVRVLSAPESRDATYSARCSAALLLGAFAARYGRLGSAVLSRVEMAAGVGTAAAILEHGRKELQYRGDVDPEVLSVVYLISALFRGNALPAAFVAWVTTFGRHIVEPRPVGVEVQPLLVSGDNGAGNRYEIVVRKDRDAYGPPSLFNLLPALMQSALTGATAGTNLLEGIRSVSRLHDEVLEGFGDTRLGIPVRFQ
jgi:hypothetical protein